MIRNVCLPSDFLEKWIRERFPVFLSFSGGSDSLMLFFLLKDAAAEHGLPFTAVHYEHGLRGADSIRDAEFCESTAREHRVPFLKFSLEVPRNREPGESVETAARRLRLQKWSDLREQGVLPANARIALAHHSGDVTETLLLRFMRGSGVSGLSALRQERVMNGLIFCRPLLAYSKEELVSALRERGITRWCHDITNDSPECCARNFIRNTVLPQIRERYGFAEKGFVRSAEALACDADFLESSASDALKTMRDGGSLRISRLRTVHPALFPRILRAFISERIHGEFIPDTRFLRRMRDIVQREKYGDTLFVPLTACPEYILQITGERLSVTEKNALAPQWDSAPEYVWNWLENGELDTVWGVFRAEPVTAVPDFQHSGREQEQEKK